MKFFHSAVFSFALLVIFTTVRCGADKFTSLTGTVVSPNFPGEYSNNHDVEYSIDVTDGLTLKAKFTAFDIIGKYPDCSHDWVEVFLGCNFTKSIGKLCSSVMPFNLYTLDHCLGIKFHSDGSKTGKGFQLKYEAHNTTDLSSEGNSCKNVTGSSSALIYSQNYPQNYPQDFHCRYVITPPKDSMIMLYFLSFELEFNPFCNSNGDIAHIKDDNDISLTKICGGNLPPGEPFFTKKYFSHITIDAKMDGDINVEQGFLIGYIAYKNEVPPTTKSCCKSTAAHAGILASVSIMLYLLFW